MRLTNERKMYAGVLSVAVLGLAADRLFFAGASPAAAYAVEPSSVAEAASKPETSASAERTPGGFAAPVPVARQFGVIASLALNDLDGFSVPPKWQEAIERQQALAQAKPTAPRAQDGEEPLADRWKRNKKLSSILRFGGEIKAVINGRDLRLGEAFDGLVLESVDEAAGTATLSDASGSVRVVLELPRPENSQR
ncbi:MAG: hypothetical protein IT438_11435 [Phycisphaerales bacterium]|nr:hypothetical protein [Phycisphaerales bacterium]